MAHHFHKEMRCVNAIIILASYNYIKQPSLVNFLRLMAKHSHSYVSQVIYTSSLCLHCSLFLSSSFFRLSIFEEIFLIR